MGYLKIIQSGDLVETYLYEKNPTDRGQGPYVVRTPRRIRGAVARSPGSIFRARKAFHRLVRANLVGDAPPALLTLTMFETVSLRASCVFFNRFIDRLRREQGQGFRYIAVPEFQKRGAVHFHVLLWGLSHYAEKESETRYFARLWLRGFCDCVTTDGHPKLASYLSKYLQKGMQDIRLGGSRAYYASRNILRPLSAASGNAAIQDIMTREVIPNDVDVLTQFTFETQWLGTCVYKSYSKKK